MIGHFDDINPRKRGGGGGGTPLHQPYRYCSELESRFGETDGTSPYYFIEIPPPPPHEKKNENIARK